jgi:SNF2 family DNA or RNA helicase
MFKGTLKPYQVEAVKKMVDKKRILVAYEMGLGKTPMTIAALEELQPKKTLVLCLASLKYQWQKEISKFSDKTSIVIDGTSAQRTKQYAEIDNYDYVIMNYEQVVNDWDIVKNFNVNAMVCDEATAIKGFRAKRAKLVKDLAKRVEIKFALTGTPIENGRPEEIFSIMQFVDYTVLGRFDIFDRTFIVRNYFGGVERYRNLPILHKTLQEASVRKSQKDEDVKPYLPDAVYREPLLVKLDKTTQKLYDHVAADLLVMLTEARDLFGANFSLAAHYGQEFNASDPANQLRGEIMARISTLRMLCSNPISVKISKESFDSTHGAAGSAYISSLGELVDDLTRTVKVAALINYLKDHLEIDPTYKVVIFSSFLESVAEIQRSAVIAGYASVKYTGQMNAKEKEEAKVRFQTEPKMRILVSSDAGGYGVDLPQANLLVNFDQPWSAGLAVQRNGRIIRTSSEWPTITIQDILVQNSIEERQYDTLRQKRSVADAILDGEGINSKGGVDLTVGSLINFLTAKQL